MLPGSGVDCFELLREALCDEGWWDLGGDSGVGEATGEAGGGVTTRSAGVLRKRIYISQ